MTKVKYCSVLELNPTTSAFRLTISLTIKIKTENSRSSFNRILKQITLNIRICLLNILDVLLHTSQGQTQNFRK